MKKCILLLLVLAITPILFAQKIADLPDLKNPFPLIVDKNEVIFRDEFTIYVYSLEPFTLKYKFGKEGDEQGDFKYKPYYIQVNPDYIAGVDWLKTVWFSREGKYLKTKQYTDFEDFDPGQEMVLLPVKETYVRITVNHDLHKRYVYLVDSNFRQLKKLHEGTYDWGTGAEISAHSYRIHFVCYEDKIFISDSERGFFINVFDHRGKRLWTIDKNKEIKKIHLSEKNKEKIIKENVLKRPDLSYEQVKQKIRFYEPVPPIDHFQISDDKIYVTTNRGKNNQHEIVILDLKGNIIKSVFLPLKSKKRNRGILRFDPYAIHNGKLYELLQNKETEKWELHVTAIE